MKDAIISLLAAVLIAERGFWQYDSALQVAVVTAVITFALMYALAYWQYFIDWLEERKKIRKRRSLLR